MPVFGQSLKTILEKSWYGGSVSRMEESANGYFGCAERLYDISYDEYSNSFTGISYAYFKYEGVTYGCRANIKGEVKTSDNSVVLTTTSIIYKDNLPEGMQWTFPTIYLTIYADETHEGHFLMHGKSSTQYYDDEYVEYCTYDILEY